ncbi:MAG: phosphotransferase [Alphaproteobacteria bacterium]|nr:phosphotransferase [Alphaproteobacteria bacterium]
MTNRDSLIAAFLVRAGWGAAERGVLAGDASFRRYDRLTRGGERAVLMDAPPPLEDVRPFLRVDRLLRRMGFSAPRILAEHAGAGLLLLEDLGDDTYTRVLANGGDEQALYGLALDVLIELHRRCADCDPDAEGLRPYDETVLLDEATLLTDWYMPAVLGRDTPAATRAAYCRLWTELRRATTEIPDTLVLRDYHVDNLMWLPDRPDVRACGLLDFQDALWGPVTYDLVSLLEDARRDVPAALARRLLDRYLAAFPSLNPEIFAASCALWGAQRSAKILGIFTRLDRRDGKPVYLEHIPRVWRWLAGDLGHPALAPLRAWFDRELPVATRIVPEATGTP